MQNASTAPSVADAIATGVPSAVPNSRPLAPASSGPGNSAQVSSALARMKAGTAAAPSGSIASRTRSDDSPPLVATSAKAIPSRRDERGDAPAGGAPGHAAPRTTATGGCAA